MRVLVVGGGGREHALTWALSTSPSVRSVVCAPGNAGIAMTARVRPLQAERPDDVVALAQDELADLVVIGPEGPLVAGVVDALLDAGITTFGPTAAAARLEGSKTFAKQIMAAAGVPTAGYWSGGDPAEARQALDRFDPPYVIKADGLAAGKGVRICADRAEAEQAIDAALVDGVFGAAGAALVIEEFLAGPECSLFGLSDGTTVRALQPAQDFKRALDGDEGLNTGGMGAYSPVPAIDATDVAKLQSSVLQPIIDEMAARGTPFVGVLYAGLALTADGPRVIEYNARFGDPETQVVLPRMTSDLGQLLLACAEGRLADVGPVAFTDDVCVTVVMASGGYPGSYATGLPISGLDVAGRMDGVTVFHAGTRSEGARALTAGGRVLAVSATGRDSVLARARAYAAVGAIDFQGAHFRTDIAARPTGSGTPG
ncbi:MAG TPA: phosphoribosylamine--glycine ligase [Euzebya sp.]|nr:phosphoribosylamine--glycine ligase [Euzebya sp.]